MVVVTVTGVRRSGAQLLGQVAELGQPDIGHAEQPGAFRREGHAAKAAHQQRHARCASSARIWRLTADWVTCRSSAASVMLMRRPTATKPRTRSSGAVWPVGMTFLKLMRKGPKYRLSTITPEASI